MIQWGTQIQCPFIIKKQTQNKKIGTEVKFFYFIKIYKKPIATIILNDDRQCFLLHMRNKVRMPTLITITQCISDKAVSQEKEIKDTDWKGRNKTVPIFRQHNSPHRKSEESTKKEKQNSPWTDEKVQQGSRIHDEHTQKTLFLHTKTNRWKPKLKIHAIYNCSKENELLVHKSNNIVWDLYT